MEDNNQIGAGNDTRASSTSHTGLLYDDVYLLHKTGHGHPECPKRLTAIVEKLKRDDLLSQLAALDPAVASTDLIATVHKPEYIKQVQRSCEGGLGYVDSPDAPASEESYQVALKAVGGVLEAIDAVMQKRIENAFCAVRPPGHHALPDEAMGFCLFNNVAVAARYIQKKYRLPKILIVDWDVHHGNGTQAIFYDDPSVLYFSVHQYPFYPGTGSKSEKGVGKGLNFTINAPLPAGCGDWEYKQVFDKMLLPAAMEFKADFVLISAGFDAHENDLLGGMRVTTQCFADLTTRVGKIASECSAGRLVSLLEGGYGEGLADSVAVHLRVLMGE